LNGDAEEDDDDNLHNFDKIYTNTKNIKTLNQHLDKSNIEIKITGINYFKKSEFL